MLALGASAFVGVTVNANDNSDRVELTGQVPSWATPASATGQVSLTAPLGINVYLRSRDAAGASNLALSVSSPASADYQKFLTPEQYRARFAPTADDVAAVSSWLRSQGLTVGSAPANNLFIPAGGTAAQVQAAFGTTLQRYTVNGESRQAPSKAVTVPRSVAGKILGVSGLATPRKNQPHVISEPPPAGFRNAPPCSTYWAEKIATDKPQAYGAFQPVAPCGLIPAQLQGAYGVANAIQNGIDGRGVTVAITDAYAAPTILFDANTYATRHGEAPFRSGQFQQIVSPTFTNQDLCGPQGWYGEETLDVEAVHAMAPGAKVLYLGAASCFDTDLLAALNTIIDNHLAQIITNSWGSAGEPPADDPILAAYEETFQQAALTGIGVFFSSGDSGDEIEFTGTRTTDYPASDPWVTAVGGTSLAVTKDNGYQFETGWGTTSSSLVGGAWKPAPPGGFLYAAGGGTSQVFAQPAYQRGVVPNSISRYFNPSGPAFRAVPDIAAVGDPQTGMLVGETQTFPEGVSYDEFRLGGTSLSSPIMAGIEALADQVQGQAHGFANPAIYSLPAAAFHDIVNPAGMVAVVRANYVNGVDAKKGIVYRLRTMNQTGTIFTRPGYDDVTGRGTPMGDLFLRAMADLGHHGGGGGNN